MKSFKRPGWLNESHRHSLAAKGVKTAYFGSKVTTFGPVTITQEVPDESLKERSDKQFAFGLSKVRADIARQNIVKDEADARRREELEGKRKYALNQMVSDDANARTFDEFDQIRARGRFKDAELLDADARLDAAKRRLDTMDYESTSQADVDTALQELTDAKRNLRMAEARANIRPVGVRAERFT